MRSAMIAVAMVCGLVGCDMPANVPLATPAVAPPQPSGIKYSRTSLGSTIWDENTMIVMEANGRRFVFLETTNMKGSGRGLVKVYEEPIKP